MQVEVAAGRGHAVPDHLAEQQRVDVAAGEHGHRRPGEVVRACPAARPPRRRRRARPPSWRARPAPAAPARATPPTPCGSRRRGRAPRRTGSSPGSPTAMPSAIVFIAGSWTGWPVRQRVRVRRRAGRLHADHAHVGSQRLDRQRDPGQQPAAAGRHQHGLDLGHLLEHLEPQGALAGHDVDVVEGVDQHRARLVGEPPRRRPATPRAPALEDHVGAVRRGSRAPWGSARPRA